MKDFLELKKNLKKNFSALKLIRVALLGDTATQFLNQAVRAAGYDAGFNLEVFEADFDQLELQAFDKHSDLYNFKPEVVIVFQASHKLLSAYNNLTPVLHSQLAEERMLKIDQLYTGISLHSEAKVIYYNYPEINDSVFGNYANKLAASFLFQQRKLNYDLMLYAATHTNFYICDLASIQNFLGKATLFPSVVYVTTEMVLSLEALPLIAARTVDLIGAMYGKSKKCLILDLDNTLWGGIIGDDGIENIELGTLGIGKVFTEFQAWIKKLKNRGIVLAVCSKNTEAIAKEPFEHHPDMVLRLEDIAIFVANWENKVDNIRHIKNSLNIDFDSMVFLDDNPFERAMVRESIVGISVPELPEDPANYLEYLYSLNLFETISFSNEDAARTKLYQIEAVRTSFSKSFTNEEDFLKNLEMISEVETFTKFNSPRVAQLSQRSNQFNLRTVRYTEADIHALMQSQAHFHFSFTLNDKFGDHGMICAVILKKETEDTLFIENWFMSCRVLKRGMEQFVLNTIVNFAKTKNYKFVKGEYLATSKNELVKNHFSNLGFEKMGEHWLFNTNKEAVMTNYIKAKKN